MDNDLLIQLLDNNNRLILPSLGAFLKKELPNGSQIVFTPFLKKDDGVLSNAIVQSFGIEPQDATAMINEFIEQIKQSLQTNGSYIFEGIGTLKTDPNGVVIMADLAIRNAPTPQPVAAPAPQQFTAPAPQPVIVPTPQPVAAPAPQQFTAPTPQPVVIPTPQPVAAPAPQQFTAPAPQPVVVPTPQPVAAPAPQTQQFQRPIAQPTINRPQIPQPKFPTAQPQQRPVNIPQQPRAPQPQSQPQSQRPVGQQPIPQQQGQPQQQQRRPIPQGQQGQPPKRPMQRAPKPKAKIDIWLIIAIIAALIVIALIIYGYVNTETNFVLPPETTSTTITTDSLPAQQ